MIPKDYHVQGIDFVYELPKYVATNLKPTLATLEDD
jgi:hypothetical protein